MMMILSIIILVLLPLSFASICPPVAANVATGTCQIYPSNGLCSQVFGNQPVYVGVNETILDLERNAASLMNILRQNRGIINDQCLLFGDSWACSNVFLGCKKSGNGNEGIPILPCRSYCEAFWDTCQLAFDAFFDAAIAKGLTSVDQFDFLFCGTSGTFSKLLTQPADSFGARPLEKQYGPFPKGYNGQLRNPPVSATFQLLNNTNVNVNCYIPNQLAAPLDTRGFGAVSCTFPLVESDDGNCLVPCPFPVIQGLDEIGLAFVIPGAIALVLCVFVLIDSVMVILSSQGWTRCACRRNFFKGSSSEPLSSDGTGMASSGNRSRGRRAALRAATFYSLIGALLGITYFIIGPLITIIRKSQVSCGTDGATINLGNVAGGNGDLSDGFCRAQRIAPFLLQLIFNLILYAIIKVFVVVTDRVRKFSRIQKILFEIVLILYCAGIPLLFLGLSVQRDVLSTNLNDFVTQFSRNAAICVPRLSVEDEIIFIFSPFIVTGLLVTLLSFYIYTHLSAISENVKGLQEGKTNSSAVALRLLMLRLSFLGIMTFLITIVFIASSASLMVEMSVYAPLFNNFFLCQVTQQSTCQTCQVEAALMNSRTPSNISFIAQIFSMSSISLLFGGFFAAQSASRLYKEYQDGHICRRRKVEEEETAWGSSMEGSFQKMEAGREGYVSCWKRFHARYNRYSQNFGRARGRVFRWGKNATKKKEKFAFVPAGNAWMGSSPTGPKSTKFANPTPWSLQATNQQFSPSASSYSTGHYTPSQSSLPASNPYYPSNKSMNSPVMQESSSWGYSESKIGRSTYSPSPFSSSGPPRLPDL